MTESVAKRVEEFTAGRLCARRALSQLGIHRYPLLIGADRRPCWPEHLVGSITHTTGFRAAVVAERIDIAAIGIDAELIHQLKPVIWPQISTTEELEWLRHVPVAEQALCAALLFSAKEAFYKCQYTLSETWLEFQDVELDLDALDIHSGEFVLRLLKEVPNLNGETLFRGRFAVEGDRVVTVVTLPR